MRILAAALALILLCGCAAGTSSQTTSSQESSKADSSQAVSSQPASSQASSQPENSATERESFVSEMEDLFVSSRKKNKDTVGYIQIPAADIDFPVVQGKDNDYYLKHTFNHVRSMYGSIFLDFRNTLTASDPLDTNTIIYGHNILYQEVMFGRLERFRKYDFAKENQFVYLMTDQGLLVFRIFAAFITDTDFYYIEPKPETDVFENLVGGALARSHFVYDTDILPTDRLLTLQTCTFEYGYGTNTRYVVMARLLREGESETPVPIFHNTNRLKPTVQKVK